MKSFTKDMTVEISAFILTTALSIAFKDDTKVVIILISILVIFLFYTYITRLTILKNLKWLKGIKIHWFDLDITKKENDLEKFKKCFSDAVINADKNFILKLNSGKLFFDHFKTELYNNENIKHFTRLIFIFSVSKDKTKRRGDSNLSKLEATLTYMHENEKKVRIFKGKPFETKFLVENWVLFNFLMIDDLFILSLGGVMIEVNLNKCHFQIKKICERIVDYSIDYSDTVFPVEQK